MLSEADQSFVFQNGWMIDHDWELFSNLLGNPFLINGLLCYYNKEKEEISICGWPITRDVVTEIELKNILLITIDQLTAQFIPYSIMLWGPIVVSLPKRTSRIYKNSSVRIKDANNVHLQIQFSGYEPPYSKRFAKQANNVYNNGVVCDTEKGGAFTAGHAKIMQTFFNQVNLPFWDTKYLSLVSTLSQSPQTRQFKAYKGPTLLGYIMVRETLMNCAIMTWSFFDKSEYRISDFLYLRTIEFYLRSGIKLLDLGYTVNDRLFKYKSKWNSNINNGAFYICTYLKTV